LCNKLIEYLYKTNLPNVQQFGFRKRYSTEDAIFKLTHEILNDLNSQTLDGNMFFDLAKAFDSVNQFYLQIKDNFKVDYS